MKAILKLRNLLQVAVALIALLSLIKPGCGVAATPYYQNSYNAYLYYYNLYYVNRGTTWAYNYYYLGYSYPYYCYYKAGYLADFYSYYDTKGSVSGGYGTYYYNLWSGRGDYYWLTY